MIAAEADAGGLDVKTIFTVVAPVILVMIGGVIAFFYKRHKQRTEDARVAAGRLAARLNSAATSIRAGAAPHTCDLTPDADNFTRLREAG
jgi:hypothetical protein